VKQITFEHEIDDWVITPWGDKGYITMLGYDEAGQQYYVCTSEVGTTGWYKQGLLMPTVRYDISIEEMTPEVQAQAQLLFRAFGGGLCHRNDSLT
jgi:hypothetical protein